MTDQKTVILDDSELDVSHYDFLRKELSEEDQQLDSKKENKENN